MSRFLHYYKSTKMRNILAQHFLSKCLTKSLLIQKKEQSLNDPIQAVLVLPGLLKRRRIFESFLPANRAGVFVWKISARLTNISVAKPKKSLNWATPPSIYEHIGI